MASDRWRWIDELESANGIADLAAVRLSKRWAGALALGRIPSRWAYAVEWLPFEQEFDLRWFATALNATPAHARQVLGSYTEAGFCRFDRRGKTWCKVSRPRSPIDRVVAIEAKLRDWRRALYQATRYLDYANQSWVVLDGNALQNALLHIDEFSRRGIGLLAMRIDGQIEIASRSAMSAPRFPHRFWQMSAEIAKHLSMSVPAV